MSTFRPRGWIVVSSILAALCPPVAADEGGLVGWVESSRGAPIAGAVVSIFGQGIRGGNLVTLSDSQGQFVLPSLPPGSYTLRAIGTGHEPSAAQRVTVLPNRDSLYTLSLTPVGEKQAAGAATSASAPETKTLREWLWLMRHKRRSVLETASAERDALAPGEGPPAPSPNAPVAASLPGLPATGPVDGSVELVATSDASALGPASLAAPGGLGALRLSGRLADGVSWSLGGLVAENEGRAWRMAAEFVLEPGGAHEIIAGAGYGAGDTRTLVSEGFVQPGRTVGAVFARDTWQVSDRLTAMAGGRYTYIGFLPDAHHGDAILAIELKGGPGTVLRGSISARSLAPGGDLLTLSTVAASPAITWARLDDGLRPSRSTRGEIGVLHRSGPGRFGAHVFQEATRDVMLTTFQGSTPFVRNAGDASARGFGVMAGGSLGGIVDGSLTYTFGRAERLGAFPPASGPDAADFHDLVARLSAIVDATDTRLTALWRVNAMSDAGRTAARSSAPKTATRFDVQLTQGLPFLEPLTRADWEVLFAVRNMFYEASQGGLLDELAVEDPPTRVVGGVAVRF